MKLMSILTDVTRCIGCEECVQACKTTNDTGKDRPHRWQRRIDDLSATRWTTIISRPGKHYVRQQCRHCLDPACVSVCPVGAMRKTAEGPVVYNPDICMGCRYCMMACPYGIPRYSWAEAAPYVRKCIMCYDKIKSGELEQPACTKACPAEATIYGERDDLLEIARRRLKDNPDLYIPRVFGEHDVGGTSVLYVSGIDLGFLGWKKDLGEKPLPLKTQAFLNSVPAVFVGVGAMMGGVYWIVDRRMSLQAEVSQSEVSEEIPPHDQESENKNDTENAGAEK